MKLLPQTLCLCLALALGLAAPPLNMEDVMMADHHGDHGHEAQDDTKPNRCEGIEFDAITPNEKGELHFFKDGYMWKNFYGDPELVKSTYREVAEHQGRVDAAIRMQTYHNDQSLNDRTLLFLGDKVFSYYYGALEKGFPKKISEVFPGVPGDLDAAVECPSGGCPTDSALFFKGNQVYVYDSRSMTLTTKKWPHLPKCTSAARWQFNYYCFHGHSFTRFHPVTGEVTGNYPMDARRYFMRCKASDWEGTGGEPSPSICKNTNLDAVTQDYLGRTYVFKGSLYMRLDNPEDGWRSFNISDTWKEVRGDAEAVFSYEDKMYFIRGDTAYLYTSGPAIGPGYTLHERFPRSLVDELDIDDPLDAAFSCDGVMTTIIKGNRIYNVDVTFNPMESMLSTDYLLPFPKVDAAICGPEGLKIFIGEDFYQYLSPSQIGLKRICPVQYDLLPTEFLSCQILQLMSVVEPPEYVDFMEMDSMDVSTKPERCEGIEFDAISTTENGDMHFFKDHYVWKNFYGDPEFMNSTYKEVSEHQPLGHVDAALRMHYPDSAEHHDHMFLFLGDKVFSYYQGALEKGFPKDISEVFPGVPSDLDAAVECPKGECVTDSALFFKGKQVYHFDIRTKTVTTKVWSHLPKCTSAARWSEHYYCFNGHDFTRFHPVTGAVTGNYPMETRKYFMRCNATYIDWEVPEGGEASLEMCNNTQVDAITRDYLGRTYAFKGNLYMRLESTDGGWHAYPISNTWKEVRGDVDAVFTYGDKMFFIKGDKVYVYKSGPASGPGYTLLEGYPKSLKEELGIKGPVDAALNCNAAATIFKGTQMYQVDLMSTPRSAVKDVLPFPKVDAAVCGPKGKMVFIEEDKFTYQGYPRAQKIASEFLGCRQ
ncbi:hemopexin-like isoform X1 [Engraulis encrasicolus]|uniref:hemopexin-like isoform X1 n=1 Tax=Engraulis encrasicolus TaxID=184585 RepID=UPI002FCE710F